MLRLNKIKKVKNGTDYVYEEWKHVKWLYQDDLNSQHIAWIFILNKVLLLIIQKNFTFSHLNVSIYILSEKNE